METAAAVAGCCIVTARRRSTGLARESEPRGPGLLDRHTISPAELTYTRPTLARGNPIAGDWRSREYGPSGRARGAHPAALCRTRAHLRRRRPGAWNPLLPRELDCLGKAPAERSIAR